MEELAGDLAFGIATMRTRAERNRAEQELRQTEARRYQLELHFVFDDENHFYSAANSSGQLAFRGL